MTPDSNELLARVEAGAEAGAMREYVTRLRQIGDWLAAKGNAHDASALYSIARELAVCQDCGKNMRDDDEPHALDCENRPPPSDDVRSALAGIVSECQRWRDEQPSSDGASKGWAQHIQGIAEAALRSAPVYGPATVSEPVAWRIRFPDGGCSQWFDGKPPKYYGSYEMAYASPQHVDREATVSADTISFPRWWITQLRDNLMKATLPHGPLGDLAFTFREQINDALNRPATVSARDGVIEELRLYKHDNPKGQTEREWNEGLDKVIRSLASGAK